MYNKQHFIKHHFFLLKTLHFKKLWGYLKDVIRLLEMTSLSETSLRNAALLYTMAAFYFVLLHIIFSYSYFIFKIMFYILFMELKGKRTIFYINCNSDTFWSTASKVREAILQGAPNGVMHRTNSDGYGFYQSQFQTVNYRFLACRSRQASIVLER